MLFETEMEYNNNFHSLKFPNELKIEHRDGFIFRFNFELKTKVNSPQENQLKTFIKSFRVRSILPFQKSETAQLKPIVYAQLAPNYLIEYNVMNESLEVLHLRKVEFKPENPFESFKIVKK